MVPRAQASSAEAGTDVLAWDRDHLDHLNERDDQDQHGRHDHRGVHDGGGLEGWTGMAELWGGRYLGNDGVDMKVAKYKQQLN